MFSRRAISSWMAVALLAFALAMPGGANAKKLIKIATQSPLSGDQSVTGIDIKHGAELAMEQLAGPLAAMGFEVELAPFDDQADPEIGVANAKRIVADPAVLAVIGHYNSGVQIPASEVYHAAGLANISPANTNPRVTTRGYLEVSRIVGRDDVQGVVGADFAAERGIKRVFVVHDTTAYGHGIAEFFRQSAEEKGMKVLGFEGTTAKAHFGAILNQVTASQPELIYFGGIAYQAAVLFRQAREQGFTGMFLSDDGFDSSDAARIAGPALVAGAGSYYSTVAGPATIYPDTTKFIADFHEKFEIDPQPYAAQGYDCMAICLKAVENAVREAGGAVPSRNAVAKAIRAMQNFKGITGSFTFNAIGDPVKSKYFMVQVKSPDPNQWNANRVIETLEVEPPE